MAHEIRIGNQRVTVREPGSVLLLSWFVPGYVVYWWWTAARDLELFDRVANGGRARIKAAVHQRLMIFGSVCGVVYAIALFAQTGRMTDAQAAARASGATPAQVDAAGAAAAGGSLTALVVIALLGTWACVIAAMVLLRRDARRAARAAGLLPEEQEPGTLAYVLYCFLLNVIGSAYCNQRMMHALWTRYPRYFASIGGTREDVDAAQQLLAPAAAGGAALPASTFTPPGNRSIGHVPPAQGIASAQPVRGVVVPQQHAANTHLQLVPPIGATPALAAAPPTPPVQQLSPAAQRMSQLEPGAKAGSLTHAESYEYAQASEQVHGADAAAPWYAYVVQTDPTNTLAAFWYGVYQLGRGDAAGVATLHRTLGDQRTAYHARERIATFLRTQGRHDEAARYDQPPGGSIAA